MIPKEKRVILTGKRYTEFRWRVYERAGWICEECGRSTPFERGQVHHVNGRGAGKRNDVLEQCKWVCNSYPNYCHTKIHNGPKPCPPKVKL